MTEVTKVETDGNLVLPEARGVWSHIRGEAVVVEVAPDRYLFVLLDGVDQLAHPTFPQFPYERPGEFRNWARAIERHRGIGVVPPEDYPMMVTFADIDIPTSVQLVDPNDLVATFGDGYSLVSLTLEITDDEVTKGRIDGLLDWFEELWPSKLDGRSIGTIETEHPLANQLSTSSFLTRAIR